MDEVAKRFGEASSWAGLAAAAWGATALGPQWLGGALGFDELAWRAILAGVALTLTIIAIALPESRDQDSGHRSQG
jgi:hypothetical protein